MATDIKALVDRFLAWPLPESVCADLCTTKQQPGRSGTNLLTADEARQMFEYLFAPTTKADQPFTVGNVARLKSGGPLMTVTQAEEERLAAAWITDDGSLQSAWFPRAALKRD